MGSIRIRMQNAQAALRELEDNADYKAWSDLAPSDRFHEFRLGVDTTELRCLTLSPDEATPDEIRGRLQGLHSLCTGPMAQFRPVIDKALAALAENGR